MMSPLVKISKMQKLTLHQTTVLDFSIMREFAGKNRS